MKTHVIISGTGRAGTTFLVAVLTKLGLDTGFDGSKTAIDETSRAGLEWDIRRPNAPFIVKSPWLCDYLGDVLRSGIAEIEHALIPVRSFHEAAASRARVSELAVSPNPPGGLWHTDNPAAQVTVLHRQFAQLFETLAAYDVPVTLLWYPRLTRDVDYLYGKLEFLLGDLGHDRFSAAFSDVTRNDWVHDFSDYRLD